MIKKHLLVVLALVLLGVSCKKEEKIEPQIQTASIESAKRWFNTQQIKLPKVLFEDLQGKLFSPHWDKAVNYVSDSVNHIYCYSVPLTETMQGKWYMNVALTAKGNNAEYVHFRRFTTSTAALSGVLNYYTIFGSFKESEILKEGKVDYSSRDKAVEGSDMLAEDNSCMDTRGYTLSCGGSGPGEGIAFSVTYSGPEIVVTASRPDPIVIGNLSDRGGSISTGGYEGGGEINYSGGGGTPGRTPMPEMIRIDVNPLKQIDLKAKLECLKNTYVPNAGYRVTLYVDQPIARSGLPYAIDPTTNEKNPGHSYVSLEKYNKLNPTQMAREVFGFYPKSQFKSMLSAAVFVSGAVQNDGNNTFDESLIIDNLTEVEFNNLVKDYSDKSANDYSLEFNNCVDFAIGGAQMQNLLKAQGVIYNVKNSYSAPSALGQELLRISNKNIISGNNLKSPISTQNCK